MIASASLHTMFVDKTLTGIAAVQTLSRAYSFLSQVVDFADVALEELYLAGRALRSLLPAIGGGGSLDLGSEVELTHLRMEKTSEGGVTPLHGTGELPQTYGGEPKRSEAERERLSSIIEVLNERFGTILGTADQLFFDQMEESWLADDHLVEQARANPLDAFRIVFDDKFLGTIVTRMDDNEEIFRRILDEPAFKAAVMEHYLRRVYERAQPGAQVSG